MYYDEVSTIENSRQISVCERWCDVGYNIPYYDLIMHEGDV